MQLSGIEVKELPNKEVLYLKKWQSNGFYPLEKAIRVGNEWHVYNSKINGWSRSFCTYTDSAFLYMLHNNCYLVTDSPMHNEGEFNFE